jgi:shikimate kinase
MGGLMAGYLRAIKKVKGTSVVLTDKPENILERIRFYDLDSRPIEKKLTGSRLGVGTA